MCLDISVIVIYFILINFISLRASKASNIDDYFLGNRSISWPLACFSIVATETSTLTFISIPGLAYIKGMGFLQIAMGYLIGRILVAFVLLPEYFQGNVDTVYGYLQKSYSSGSRKAVSVIFHITRLLADSVRLFATAIPLAMLLGFDSFTLPVVIIGAATFIYTFFGGIKSVVVADSIQFFLYIICAFTGMYIVLDITGFSFVEMLGMIPCEKIMIFSTGFEGSENSVFNSYNVFSGLLGGAFLSFASHGTDQLIVQRVLSCKTKKDGQKAMIMSGILVLLQFALFMVFGLFLLMLFKNRAFSMSDEIIPSFIIDYLPAGVRGLMLAGIFAAAMSTLSSSINSLSSSTVIDIFSIEKKDYSDKKRLSISRRVSLFWTIAIIITSVFLFESTKPLVEIGLSIASVTYGGMLGIFITGRFMPWINEKPAITAVFAGIISVLIISWRFDLFWPWYVPCGFFITLAFASVFQIAGYFFINYKNSKRK